MKPVATPISETEYKALRARYDAFEQWRNGRTSYHTSEVPKGLEVTNEDRAKIEIYEFVKDPPAKYSAYVKRVDAEGNEAPNSLRVQITIWPGDVIGNAMMGVSFECPAFGRPSKRNSIFKFKAINGKWYYGTYYASSGDYCLLKQAKGPK